jgi:hypothetical protein
MTETGRTKIANKRMFAEDLYDFGNPFAQGGGRVIVLGDLSRRLGRIATGSQPRIGQYLSVAMIWSISASTLSTEILPL